MARLRKMMLEELQRTQLFRDHHTQLPARRDRLRQNILESLPTSSIRPNGLCNIICALRLACAFLEVNLSLAILSASTINSLGQPLFGIKCAFNINNSLLPGSGNRGRKGTLSSGSESGSSCKSISRREDNEIAH